MAIINILLIYIFTTLIFCKTNRNFLKIVVVCNGEVIKTTIVDDFPKNLLFTETFPGRRNGCDKLAISKMGISLLGSLYNRVHHLHNCAYS